MHEGSKILGIMRKAVVTLGLALGFLAVLGTDVHAQVTVQLSPGSQMPELLTATGMTQPELEAFLTNKLNDLFQMSNAAGFLQRFGDAQNFTSKGLGVDYASEATYVEVGGSASFALGMDKSYQPGNALPVSVQSVGMNASLMGGVSLMPFGIPVMLFGNGMHVPTQQYGDMSGSLDNWGVHAQLRLFGPSRSSSALKMLLRWGGIAITTGYDYSHMSLRLNHSFLSKFSIPNSLTDGVNVDVTGTASGSAIFGVDMTTKSIPLEITTSLRLLSLLTAYGGMGFDFNLGGSSAMTLDLYPTLLGHTSLPGWENLDLGSAHVKVVVPSVGPSAAKIRGIMGLQINLFMIRLFTQVNITNTNPTMASLAAGVRVAY
jgi:hypothetical protein